MTDRLEKITKRVKELRDLADRLEKITKRVKELKDLADKATPGPWHVRHRHIGLTPDHDEQACLGLEIDEVPRPTRGQFAKSADAQLAAAAPEMVELLMEIMQILAEIADSKGFGL